MEGSSFQSQLLSVMEVLAQAAVAEINRRVDDSCAVLRVELSQSRRDIELLKSKYEEMEAELRRSRRRARRRGGDAAAPSTQTSLHQMFFVFFNLVLILLQLVTSLQQMRRFLLHPKFATVRAQTGTQRWELSLQTSPNR